jgi:oligopeptide transport system substrate-binding protein
MILNSLKFLLFSGLFFGTLLFADSSLVRANGNEPITLYPFGDQNALAGNIKRDLFEPLMSKDREGNIILGQAKSYTVDKTKTIYTFTLREDVRWSDGTAVTAHDFEYAYLYMADPKNHSIRAYYLGALNILNAKEVIEGKKPLESLGVKAIDEKILQITLVSPTYYFLAGLSNVTMSPISKKIIEDSGRFLGSPQKMVSNGAYLLDEWKRGSKIVLKKNPYYYDAKNVQIDKVSYLSIDKESKALRLYKSGKIDYVDEVPKNRYSDLKNLYPEELKTSALLGTYYLSINLKKPPFDQLKIRKALSYAIDRETIATKVMGTGENPLYTFLPKGMSAYLSPIMDYQKWTQAQRDNKAKQLLEEAGITVKNPLRFELLYNTNEQNRRVLLSVIRMWKKVFDGKIFVKLKAEEWNSYQKEKNHYDVVRIGWISEINDPSNILEIFMQNHSYNHAQYHNHTFEEILTKARDTEDVEKRALLYQKLELILAEDLPVIPLFQFSTARLIKPYVRGYKSTPLDTVFSKYLSIEGKPND